MFTQPFNQAQIKENMEAPVTDLCEGNSPVTGEFPSQEASNTENVSIWPFDDVIMMGAITYPRPNFNGGSTESPL